MMMKQLRKQLLRDKCLRALKRRHWQAILDCANIGISPLPACIGKFVPSSGRTGGCSYYLKKKDATCQACTIITKLWEVLDE